ncbi:MAG: DUF3649 domain-containing protein [Comamonas sp.]
MNPISNAPSASTAHPGLSVLSRLLAAVVGGYLLASALAVFLAAVLPAARAEAVLAGMQWSFALHALAAVWAFAPVSPGKVWLGIALPTLLLAAGAALLGH